MNVDEETMARVTAFVRTIVHDCTECHRTHLCGECTLRPARNLLLELQAASRGFVRMSFGRRAAILLNRIREAGEPVPAERIESRDLCSRALKHWTLRRMASIGMIKAEKRGLTVYFSPVDGGIL